MNRIPTLMVLLAACCGSGCTFYLGRAAADRAAVAPAADAAPAASTAARSASRDQQCSQLRADIGSSQHNQRSGAPASQAPIIAAASTGKEDQRIEALQKRYAELGCTGTPGPEPATRRSEPRAP